MDDEQLVLMISTDVHKMIESYTDMLGANGKEYNLLVLGTIQAVLQELYKKHIGEENAAMFFYGVADRIVATKVNREGYKGLKSITGKRNNNGRK